MAHYAKVQNGKVTQVIVARPDYFDTNIDKTQGVWIQTSYNTHGGIHFGPDGKPDDKEPLRKNYAGVGYTYDEERDAFIPPKPFASWVLNESSCLWESPVPQPTDGKPYTWDESTQSWDEVIVPEPTNDNQ